MDNLRLSNRAQILLKDLIELYIRDGEPVGSRTLANVTSNDLSPATVRKVLSDLESQGYLSSPHTSAGRLPTNLGLRFFVDSLLTSQPLGEKQLANVRQKLDPNKPTDDLISSASNILSELTQMVGVVTVPKREKLVLRHVEFFPLAENQVLAILVLNEKEVQNRVIETQQKYTASALTQASNFLNQHFAGRDLLSARKELLQALQIDRVQMDSLMQAVVDVAGKAFVSEPVDQDYVLAGQQNLLSDSSYVKMSQLQKLFGAFTEKQQILGILDQCLQSDGVQMYIGEESGYEAFHDHSVITSRYAVDGELVGVLGVIGPTRMPYDKIIPIVDLTARMLGTALDQDK
jgi:heat-inducible transcriptional repressor